MVKDELARAALEATRKWAIEELDAAQDRATKLRVGGSAYNDAINAIHYLMDVINRITYSLEEKAPDEDLGCAPLGESLIEAGPTPVEPEPEPEPEPTEPERPIPKLEDVRGKCGEAKKAGVDIKGILNDLGYKNLSSVDPKDYNTLLDKVNTAREALG